MTIILLFACLLVVLAALASPYRVWRKIPTIAKAVLEEESLPLARRLALLKPLAGEVLWAPMFGLLHLADELLYSSYKRQVISSPVFIVGQPRSGTTFLHRAVHDEETFLALQHLEWRFPFITFWKLIDALGLRSWLEGLSYWPKNEAGKLAERLHHDHLGSHEEHGVFYEERCLHHFFLFRRYPIPSLLGALAEFGSLPPAEVDWMVLEMKRAVQKALWFRGTDKIWLTKENESVDLYRSMSMHFPDARYVFISRAPANFLPSYVNLSVTSTMAKTGVDPRRIPGWDEANTNFRRAECRKFVDFAAETAATRRVVSITFEELTERPAAALRHIRKTLDIGTPDAYVIRLTDIEGQQAGRDKGYENAPVQIHGFEFFEQHNRHFQADADHLGRAPSPAHGK
jgi:hypothetical protein